MGVAVNLSKFGRIRFVDDQGRLTREAQVEMNAVQERSGGVTGVILAGSISYSPSGGLASTNAQDALDELELEKQEKDPTLTAVAGVTTGANKLIYWTDVDTASVCDFTSFARSLVAGVNAAAVRTTLGLGTLATQNGTFSGTSSGTNTGDETAQRIGTLINGATSKTTPVDADQIGLMDSAASNVLKKLSWANIKATLKTYFDTLYQATGSYLTSGGTNNIGTATGTSLTVTGALTSSGGAVGYTTGAGGTVTQITDKTTAVTLDKRTGRITLAAGNLAAGATARFFLNNSTIGVDDVIYPQRVTGGTGGVYDVWCDSISVTGGRCTINVKNTGAVDLNEQPVLGFVVISGATA